VGILIKPLSILGLVAVFSAAPLAISEPQKIMVVTNASDLGLINKQQLKQIYMKGISYNLKPINLNKGNKTRAIFNSTIIGLTESRINSYWVQMEFSGKAEAPLEFDNIKSILNQLNQESRSIAYLPQGTEIPNDLHIIYTLEY